MIMPLIAFSQKSDSSILVPKWKLEKLLQSYFYTGPICDSTVTKMGTEISRLNHTLKASEELSAVYLIQRDNKVAETVTLRNQLDNTKSTHEQQIKQIKRQKLNIIVIAIAEALLLVISVL